MNKGIERKKEKTVVAEECNRHSYRDGIFLIDFSYYVCVLCVLFVAVQFLLCS